jgi:histidinol-phosphatase (PHP family)
VQLDLPLDSHMHTDFSTDATGTIDVYAALAREQGLAELAITDHLDFDRRLANFAPHDFARRERAVREAAERWDGRPAIRFGVEITYQRELEQQIREYLATHRYDYVIGSVHTLSGIPDDKPDPIARWAAGKSHREASAPYWAELDVAIRCGLFDTIGHLDVVKRWLYRALGPFEYEPHADLYDRALNALIETGVALEVNSSGLRHKQKEAYPPPVVVERFRALGGERVTAGTDVHREESFGFGLRDVYGSIQSAGFRALTFRRGGKRVRIELEQHRAQSPKPPVEAAEGVRGSAGRRG